MSNWKCPCDIAIDFVMENASRGDGCTVTFQAWPASGLKDPPVASHLSLLSHGIQRERKHSAGEGLGPGTDLEDPTLLTNGRRCMVRCIGAAQHIDCASCATGGGEPHLAAPRRWEVSMARVTFVQCCFWEQ